MMLLYPKLAWRDIRQSPARALLTTLSIVIGVGAVLAVEFTTETTRRSFDEAFRTIAGRAHLEVTAPSGTTIDARLVEKLDQVPGVQAVAPLLQRYTVMYLGNDRRVQLPVLGIDPQRDAAIHDFQMVAGESLERTNGILLNVAIAENLGVKLHDELKLLTRRGLVRMQVAGLYSSRDVATSGQGAVLLMKLRTAQHLFKAPDKCDSIQIVLQTGAKQASVESQIAGMLPESISVGPPGPHSSVAEQTRLEIEIALKMASLYVLVVALFIIANTLLICVMQRQRPLGMIRAIGATRRQIAAVVVTEALMFGVTGTLIGCALGLVMAHYLTLAMGSLYCTTLPAVEFQPQPFLFAATIGMIITLLGAFMPAHKASLLTPLEAMRDIVPETTQDLSRRLTVTGWILVLLSSGLLVATIAGRLPALGVVWQSVSLLVGLILLLPHVLVPFSWLVKAALSKWMRAEGHLARRQLLRRPTRTTLTTGVVFIAISTGIGLAFTVTDNVQDVRNWYKKSITADFFVRAMMPEMATGLAADVPDQLDAEIRGVSGVNSIEAVRLVKVKAAGKSVVLVARDFPETGDLNLDLVASHEGDVRNRLRDGEIVIGSVFAQNAQLKVGDTVILEFEDQRQDFRVAAIANDYQAGGLTVYVDRDIAHQRLGVEGVTGYIILANHTHLESVRTDLEALCGKYGLLLQSYSDVHRTIDAMISGVVAGLWGLVVLTFVVAAFGVANTLAMTVLEQSREIAMLRVIAMTRGQIRKLILAQALTISVMAVVPGVAAGLGIAYVIHWATYPVIGHPVPFGVHPWLLAGAMVGGLLIAVATAWVPAERAARIDLSTALHYS